MNEADVDGFNLVSFWFKQRPRHVKANCLWQKAYAIKPGSFKDIISLLIPELHERGLFWDDYTVTKGTYRESLYSKVGQTVAPEDHPASKYRWNAGVDAADHKIPEDE